MEGAGVGAGVGAGAVVGAGVIGLTGAGVAGCFSAVGVGAAGAASPSLLPHWVQNFIPSGTALAQLGHFCIRLTPVSARTFGYARQPQRINSSWLEAL